MLFRSLQVTAGRQVTTLRNARLLSPSVRPGGTARIAIEFERWRGGRETRTVEVEVPEDLPEGRYPLYLGGGLEADRFLATRLPARFRPVSFEDAWQRLAASRRSDALNLLLWGRASEVSRDGEDLPNLPGSATAVLAPAQLTGDRARRADWVLLRDQRVSDPGVVRGELMLDLVVDRRAP